MSSIRLSRPQDLLASIPALLGFVPAQSMVFVPLADTADGMTLGTVMRTDIPDEADTESYLAYLLDVAARHDITHVVVVCVADDADPDHLPHRALLDALQNTYQRHGITVPDRVWIPALHAGAPWRSYTHPHHHGTIDDPHTTPLITELTVRGHVTYRSREELHAQLTPVDTATLHRRATLLQPLVAAVHADTAAEYRPQRLATLRHALDQATQGHLPTTDAEIVSIASVLADPVVRDTAMTLTRLDDAPLWTHLLRNTPAPVNAEAAAVLAVHAYTRGDGALARAAIDRALTMTPGHRAARLLDTALRAAIPADHIRAVLEQVAADLRG